jgi:ATP-binding cassette subfamily G (WHITE) protein 2 (PDR)
MLRQPHTVSKEEKYQFVEEVIEMLNMSEFANAVVGIPGQGLNVEQRKLLTIGVELAAKPKLLLFLDEPTSGLDSQSSWAICAFLRKLADAGQAVLCTIHQPSAILFQEFDRLLFLARGGKTVYFGDIGEDSQTLLKYFESNGARKCDGQENPAEYMLEIVNKGVNDKDQDWHSVWKSSPEFQAVYTEIDNIHASKQGESEQIEDKSVHSEFAMPYWTQLVVVTRRVFQQYWRLPSYIASKCILGVAAGLFIGFTFFQAKVNQAGMSDILFSVFMLTTIFSSLVQQIQPQFVIQRSLYEVREKPSKAYSWSAFLIANIVVEIPYQIFAAILAFASYYYAVVGRHQSSDRQGLVLLFCIQLFIYASAFAHMCIAALPDAQTAAAVVTLLTMMSTLFAGVLQGPTALPGFWIFMYRLSPFSYWISGIVSTQLHDRQVTCSDSETNKFAPPSGMTCSDYLAPFLSDAPGYLLSPNSTTECEYCSVSVADEYIAASGIYWSDRWRNFGIMWGYILFNIAVAVSTYYLFRVRKWKKSGVKKAGNKKTSVTKTEKDEEQHEEKKVDDSTGTSVVRVGSDKPE